MKRGKVYDSLPPLVKGEKVGQIVVRIPKIQFEKKRQSNLAGFRVEFTWWGMVRRNPVSLSIPWKPGQVIDEAVFPIVVKPPELQGYFEDMGNFLEVQVLENNITFGTASIPLNNLSFSGTIPISSGKKDQYNAFLAVEVISAFEENNSLVKPITNSRPQENLLDSFEKLEVNA